MKTKNIHTMTPKDIEEKKASLKMELIKLEGQKATGTNPKNPGNIRKFKKTIAKMNTILTQKSKMPTKKEDSKKQ